MKTKKIVPEQVISLEKRIKVKLDYKTTLIINRLSSLAVWKTRYPDAVIVR